VDEVAVKQCLQAQIGELIRAFRLNRRGQFGQVEIQQFRRQQLKRNAFL